MPASAAVSTILMPLKHLIQSIGVFTKKGKELVLTLTEALYSIGLFDVRFVKRLTIFNVMH